MNQKIEFNYNGKDYTLEYNRAAVKLLENNGLRIDQIQSQPFSAIDLLWQGAFMMNHKNEKPDKIREIYEHIGNKGELNAALIEMYTDTYRSLITDDEDDDSKKIEWKMN